jgi:Trk-type K+ transport system membrane component
MDNKDKNIRMQWLIGLCLMFVYSLGHFLYQLEHPSTDHSIPHYRLFFTAFSLFCTAGFSFIFYRCAYKKPGTKLLFLSLILTGLGFLSPIGYLTEVLPLPPYITHLNLYLIFETNLEVIWFVLCWRMRQLNKKLMRQNMPTPI